LVCVQGGAVARPAHEDVTMDPMQALCVSVLRHASGTADARALPSRPQSRKP
jgi:hypothetical protein